jgi:hypothetical protein
MMVRTLKQQWGNLLTMALGLLTALLIFPLAVQSTQWLQDWYDESNPVVKAKLMKAERVDQDTLRLQFLVTRQRDCEFVRLFGMTGTSSLDMYAAFVRREDGEEPVSYPTGITVASRNWLLSPVRGNRLMLWAYYDCADRLVRTKMIDEVIKP